MSKNRACFVEAVKRRAFRLGRAGFLEAPFVFQSSLSDSKQRQEAKMSKANIYKIFVLIHMMQFFQFKYPVGYLKCREVLMFAIVTDPPILSELMMHMILYIKDDQGFIFDFNTFLQFRPAV